jgi:hypothetical protein
MIEVAVARARGSCRYSSSVVAKGRGKVDLGGCRWVGIRWLCSCYPPRRPHIYLRARHVHAYAPPRTLLTYQPHSKSEMTWNDGYDGVLLASETKKRSVVSAGFIVHRCWWER